MFRILAPLTIAVAASPAIAADVQVTSQGPIVELAITER